MSKIFNLFLIMFLILVTIQSASVEAEAQVEGYYGGKGKGRHYRRGGKWGGVKSYHTKVTRYAVKPVTVCWKQVVVWKKISCCCNKKRHGPKRCICFRKFLAWKKVGCCRNRKH